MGTLPNLPNNNYDGPEIAKIALGEPYRLYEEAKIGVKILLFSFL